MKQVNKKLRVYHFPQIGSVRKAFYVEVKDEEQASLIVNTLAIQHLWLYSKQIIPDYSNSIGVEMFEDNEWVNYYNEEEDMEWDEFEETYFSYINKKIHESNGLNESSLIGHL